MLVRKEQRMLKLQQDILDRKMQADPDAFNPPLKPKINENSTKLVEENRRNRDVSFTDSLQIWKQIKEDKKKLRQIAKQIEEASECTFQPNLRKANYFDVRSHSNDTSLLTNTEKTDGKWFFQRQIVQQDKKAKRIEVL